MNVKIDTKEIFYVISLNEENLTANMAEFIRKLIAERQNDSNKSIVINLEKVIEIERESIEILTKIHEECYKNKCSFVLCGLTDTVRSAFNSLKLLEKINVTPTESEAWDIVQMEEIERELNMDFE